MTPTRSTPTDPRLSVQASGLRTDTTPSLTDELYGVLSPEQRSSETSLRNNTFQIITLYAPSPPKLGWLLASSSSTSHPSLAISFPLPSNLTWPTTELQPLRKRSGTLQAKSWTFQRPQLSFRSVAPPERSMPLCLCRSAPRAQPPNLRRRQRMKQRSSFAGRRRNLACAI